MIHSLWQNIKLNTTAGAAPIPPQVLNNSTAPAAATTGWVSMQDYEQVGAICVTGVMAGGGIVTFTLQEARNAAGGGAQALAGKTVTLLAATGASTISGLECKSEELSDGFTHVRLVAVETGVVNCYACGILGRLEPHYKQTTLPA
jgi:hypothetical protein